VRIRFAALAARELNEAADFYLSKRRGLAERFLAQIDGTLALLKREPRVGAPFVRDVRRLRLLRFPYWIVYSVGADVIHIHAVAHMKRRPTYWLRRVPKQPKP
jgi:plasmid stabilization system protein ParE